MRFLFLIVVIVLAGLHYEEQRSNAQVNHPPVNLCPYEGAECPNAQEVMKDYQLYLHYDTMILFDAGRIVDTIINTDYDSKLDSVIMNDNR